MRTPVWHLPIEAHQIIAAEVILVLAALAVSISAGRRRFQKLRRINEAFSRLARQKVLCLVLAGLLPVVFRLAMLPVMPPPQVQVEEEASNLLQADTFASGRLANPPLPFPDHFDTMQVLQRPKYVSIRPPGQGAFLALGQVIFGSPWAGVCLSVALMCVAVCWMLQGWFAPQWALLGGLLLGIRIGVLSFWMNSYWGGAVAAAGAALVLGAYPRLVRTNAFRHVFLMWVGIALVLTTRTFEGGVLLIPVAIAIGIHAFSQGGATPRRVRLLRVAAPGFLLLVLLATWFAYYNWRTTGSATTSTYMLGRQTQNIAPAFMFGKVAPMHHFSNPQMRQRFGGWEMMKYLPMLHPRGWWMLTTWKIQASWSFYIRPLFTLPLLCIPFFACDRRVRLCLAIVGAGVVGALLEVWGPPYYFAPYLPVLMILTIQGLRHLHALRFSGSRPGRLFTKLVPMIALSVFLGLVSLRVCGIHVTGEDVFQWSSYENRMPQRAVVEQLLNEKPGQHLVFVRYTPRHDFLNEWVFNKADLQDAKVVWAREYEPERNQQLAAYFAGRKVWLVKADDPNAAPEPYPGEGASEYSQSRSASVQR